MTDPLLWTLRGMEGAILVVGLLVAYWSLQAYRRTRESSLLFLGIGFLLVSAAAAVAGLVFEVLTGQNYLLAWTLSSTVDLLGFLVIFYSILRPPSRTPRPPGPE